MTSRGFLYGDSSIDSGLLVQEVNNHGELSLARNFACDDLWRARLRGKETSSNL